jgi:hypothetical protein
VASSSLQCDVTSNQRSVSSHLGVRRRGVAKTNKRRQFNVVTGSCGDTPEPLNPKLPNVLMIGDSISEPGSGYGPVAHCILLHSDSSRRPFQTPLMTHPDAPLPSSRPPFAFFRVSAISFKLVACCVVLCCVVCCVVVLLCCVVCCVVSFSFLSPSSIPSPF